MADTSFDIDLNVTSESVRPAAAALVELTNQLAAAGQASTAASDAVRSAEAAYRQAEVSADRAAKALERIGASAEAQRGKLREALEVGDDVGIARASAALSVLEQRENEARVKATAATAALAAQAATLDRLKVAASDAAATEQRLTEEQTKAAAAMKKAQAESERAASAAKGTGQYSALAEGLSKLPGPLGSVGQKAFATAEGLKKLATAAGTSAGAVLAVVVVIAAVAAALVVGVAAIVKWSVAMSEAARSTELLNEGIAQSVEGGQALTAKIADLSKRVPQSRDELQKMAADLAKTGLRGKELADALEDAAVRAAKQKFGPGWERQMLSLDKQTAVFKGHIQDIFGSLNVEGLLSALAKIVGLFDASSASGRAIKVVFVDLFQKLVDGLAALAPMIVSAFIQAEIWALRALIAIKPYGSQILMVGKALAVLAGIVVGVIGAAIVWFAVVATAFYSVIAMSVKVAVELGTALYNAGASVVAFAAAILGEPGKAIEWLKGKFDEVVAFLSGLNLGELGTQIMLGLAQGLLGGGPAIFDAISGVVGGAIDSAKKLLGIASPSRVFAEIGAHTAAGMAAGVEGGTDGVQSSMADMIASPADGGGAGGGGAAAGGAAGSSSSSSSRVDLSGMQIVINGVKDGADAAARVRDALIEILDGEVAQAGAAEASA